MQPIAQRSWLYIFGLHFDSKLLNDRNISRILVVEVNPLQLCPGNYQVLALHRHKRRSGVSCLPGKHRKKPDDYWKLCDENFLRSCGPHRRLCWTCPILRQHDHPDKLQFPPDMQMLLHPIGMEVHLLRIPRQQLTSNPQYIGSMQS